MKIQYNVVVIVSCNNSNTGTRTPRAQAAGIVGLNKLPEDASETLGSSMSETTTHVPAPGTMWVTPLRSGRLKILSQDYENGRWRVRWK